MKAYDEEVRSEEARRWLFFRYACFIGLIGALVIFVLSFGSHFTQLTRTAEKKDVMILMLSVMLGVSLAAVAMILAGIYYNIYTFFNRDKFYFFIFVSWVANAVYLLPELIGPQPEEKRYTTGVFVLSLISTLFLALALRYRGERQLPRRSLVVATLAGGACLAADLICIEYLLPESYQAQATLVLFSSVPTFLLLWWIGDLVTAHLKEHTYRRSLGAVLYTFYFYGLLQFLYPFRRYWGVVAVPWLLTVFVAAQLSKAINAISVMGALQSATAHRDFKRAQEAREAESKRAEEAREAKNRLRLRELELEAQGEKLQREEQYVQLGKLASVIRHDVNTSLASMGFDVDALKDQYQHENMLLKRLETIEESMGRISAIVKAVDYFRGDKAYYNRDKLMSKVSMLEVVHRAVRLVKNEKEELKQNKARSRIRVGGKDVWVRANLPMLEQMVVNVIKNGLEAIDEAGRPNGLIDIKVGTTRLPGSEYGRWVKVEITDNGCGIPAENIEKLTTLFTTRSDKKPNSGIGLFIGKKILDIHDGDIKFESKLGEQTTVTLLLPEWNALQKQQAGAPAEEAEEEGEETITQDLVIGGAEGAAPAELTGNSGGS